MKKRIAALALVLVFCLGGVVVPASASGLEATSKGGFFTGLAQAGVTDWSRWGGANISGALGLSCSGSTDNLHHGPVIEAVKNGFQCKCSYCGDYFLARPADIAAAYKESSGGMNYGSDGVTRMDDFTWSYAPYSDSVKIHAQNKNVPSTTYSAIQNGTAHAPIVTSNTFTLVPGEYSLLASTDIVFDYFKTERNHSVIVERFLFNETWDLVAYVSFSGNSGVMEVFSSTNPTSFSVLEKGFVYRIRLSLPGISRGGIDSFTSFSCGEPVISSSMIFPGIDRVGSGETSFTFGVQTGDGSFSPVSGIGTLFNEGQMTYYNPQTQNYQPVSNWKYDYSDRSYSFDTDGGKVGKVVYGDDVASVTLTDSDGNTITYNYYYMVDSNGVGGGGGGGTVNPSPSPGPGGSTGNSNSNNSNNDGSWFGDVIINIGDIIGNILGGPGGGSGGEGGEESGGGFFGWLGGKLGELLGAIGGGFLSLIQEALGTVLDGLIYMVTMITEKLGTVVDTLLSVLDEIPGIFEGFTGFLEQVFSFFPPEIVTIITFGILMMVLVTVIKHFLG